jgi:hypothetical protein
MPYTPAQHRLFEAAAHSPQIAQAHGIPVGSAQKMASEGIKAPGASQPKLPRAKMRTRGQVLAQALNSMKGQQP